MTALAHVGIGERRLALSHLALGVSLLVAPRPLEHLVAGRPSRRIERVVARALGVRHLVEGLVLARRHDPRTLTAAAAVDALHAASMVALAVRRTGCGRLALASAATSTALGSVALAAAVTRGPLGRPDDARVIDWGRPRAGDRRRTRACIERWSSSVAL